MLGLRELAIRSPMPLTVSHRICYTYNIFDGEYYNKLFFLVVWV